MLIILILGSMMVTLSNVQEAQAGQATIKTMMTPNKLSPDLYTAQEAPPIAAARPQIPELARSGGMGQSDTLMTLVSIAVVFIVGFLSSFGWKLLKKVAPPLQEQPLHQSNSESGSSHRTPQMMMRSPTRRLLKEFTLREILTMTDCFKVILGEGGQGRVCEGSLPGSKPRQKVAVKKLDRDKALDGLSGNRSEDVKNQDSPEKEFWNKLYRISRLHHRNIVALLGYCIEGGQLFLVYEFMENGSLQQHLHGMTIEGSTKSTRHFLDWGERMQVAVDVAKGLEYLHNHAKPTLVHCDINPSNILLGVGMHAKITNFGVSKRQTLDVTTSLYLKGTPGYLDPVYCKTGQVSTKNDVYSYGVVLLELVTGKRAIERMTSLVTWCREFLSSDRDLWPLLLSRMVDDEINPGSKLIAQKQLLEVVRLAMDCVDDNPYKRPSMREVVKRLCIADGEDASSAESDEDSSSEVSSEDSFSNIGGTSIDTSASSGSLIYSQENSSNGWSSYEITDTSIIIKYMVKNKKIAVRCKLWTKITDLDLNKIEATLDDTLLWRKRLWTIARSSMKFSVDEVKLQAEWKVGVRFRWPSLKEGDPRRYQGPFCVEYLALKDEIGWPLVEYHRDRSPVLLAHKLESSLGSHVVPFHQQRSSLMQDGFTIQEEFYSQSRINFTEVEVDGHQSCRPPGKGHDHHQQISNYENPFGSRKVSLNESFGSDDYVQQQKQSSTVEVGDTSENCFQIGLPQLENDLILFVGRKGTFEGADAIEFLFEQVEDMSKVVGVGLQRSKVVVTEQFGVMVIQISEHMWLDLWKETSFVPMSINVPKLPINYKFPMCNLTPEESSKRFGVGLGGFRSEGLCMYVEDNMSKQTGEMFPLIFELAEKMGLKSENAKPSWLQHLKDVSTETLEGEVRDQGGSSNEPMDGGDHDQGATSHEPMEGAVSTQGGTSSEHMELGGQVDQQSFGGNPFQLLSESPSGRGPIVSEKNGSLTVIVIPECGGTFHKGLTKELAEPDGRIKSATIAPWLKFKFEKLGDSRKITTTIVTQCNLGGGQLKYHEDLDLGYYHDNITISLTCEENLAARLLCGTVTSIDLTKSSMTETFTGSRSIANQMSGQANVQVQIPLVGVGMQAQGNLGVIDTFGDSRAIAATMESSNTQFAGFLVNPNECPGSLNFNFLYHVEIMEEIAKGRRQFMHAGINKTLWPTIVGEWVPLDWEEARLYKFKTERDITSIRSLRRSTAKGEMPVFMQQRYEVSMFINHAMNHIHRYGTTELQGPGVQSLPKVLTKFPAI